MHVSVFQPIWFGPQGRQQSWTSWGVQDAPLRISSPASVGPRKQAGEKFGSSGGFTVLPPVPPPPPLPPLPVEPPLPLVAPSPPSPIPPSPPGAPPAPDEPPVVTSLPPVAIVPALPPVAFAPPV